MTFILTLCKMAISWRFHAKNAVLSILNVINIQTAPPKFTPYAEYEISEVWQI